MKRLSLFFMLSAMCSVMFAQQVERAVHALQKAQPELTPKKETSLKKRNIKADENVIYSYTFDSSDWVTTWDSVFNVVNQNNFPSEWSLGENQVDGSTHNYLWHWSLRGPRGAYTSDPAAVPAGFVPNDDDIPNTPSNQILEDDTYNRGFMLLESDYYNTNENGTIVDNPVNMDTWMQWGPLDFTDYDAATLTFSQTHRLCCTDYGPAAGIQVMVADNSEFTNASRISVHQADINSSPANPSVFSTPISAQAAQKSEVYIRWYQLGQSHYFWAVDDIKIIYPIESNAELIQYWVDYYNNGYRQTITNAEGVFEDLARKRYTGIPYTTPYWATQTILGSRAYLQNIGRIPLGDISMTTKYIKETVDGEEELYSKTHLKEMRDLIPGGRDSLWINTAKAAPGDNPELEYNIPRNISSVGSYKATGLIETFNADMDNTDNTYEHLFRVSHNVLGYANPANANTAVASPGDYVGYVHGDAIGFITGLPKATTPYLLQGVNIFITNNSLNRETWDEVGFFQLRALVKDINQDPFVDIIQSEQVNVGPEWAGRWLFIPFIKNGNNEFLAPANDDMDYAVLVQTSSASTTQTRICIGADINRHSSFESIRLWHPATPNQISYVSARVAVAMELVIDKDEETPAPTGSITVNVYDSTNVTQLALPEETTITLVSTNPETGEKVDDVQQGNPVTFNNVSVGGHSIVLKTRIGGKIDSIRSYNEGVYDENLVTRDIYVNTGTLQGILDNPAPAFNVYPNPANDKLIVQSANSSKIIVSNIIGQQVTVINNPLYEQTINLESYTMGVYMVTVVDKNGNQTTQRFIKQ